MSSASSVVERPAARGGGGVAQGHAHERWVYLWEWPIRSMHWLAVAAIVTLAVTGLYIGKPFFFPAARDTGPHFMMGWMRFLHFAAAGVLVATAIVRLYWLFIGNRYARWRALFPLTPRRLRDVGGVVKYYLMVGEEPHYLGHNPLQQLAYTAIYGLAGIMVLTGFALYGQANPGGFFAGAFGWVVSLCGGLQAVRVVHYVLTWVFVIFVPVHVYLALRVRWVERSGGVTSMISGGRWVPADVEYVDE